MVLICWCSLWSIRMGVLFHFLKICEFSENFRNNRFLKILSLQLSAFSPSLAVASLVFKSIYLTGSNSATDSKSVRDKKDLMFWYSTQVEQRKNFVAISWSSYIKMPIKMHMNDSKKSFLKLTSSYIFPAHAIENYYRMLIS